MITFVIWGKLSVKTIVELATAIGVLVKVLQSLP